MFNHFKTKKIAFLPALLYSTFFFACAPSTPDLAPNELSQAVPPPSDCSVDPEINWSDIASTIDSSASYDDFKDVAAYLCKYRTLPHNYVKKNEARHECEIKRGTGNCPHFNYNPEEFLGVMVGGDTFGNREKALPDLSQGENYTEADVDYDKESNRGKNRLIFILKDDSCIIYHTEDHYKPGSFCKLHPIKMYQ